MPAQPSFRSVPAALTAAVLTVASPGAFALADTVVFRDGSRVEGTVLSMDGDRVTLKDEEGIRVFSRDRVESIHLSGEESSLPPLKVELRSLGADDSIEVLLEGEVVLTGGYGPTEWTDLTPRLKDGNNELTLRIHNDRGSWAYRLSLRVNGIATSLACGTPRKLDQACTCCGYKGSERGVIEELDPVWLFVDRKTGSAEVLP